MSRHEYEGLAKLLRMTKPMKGEGDDLCFRCRLSQWQNDVKALTEFLALNNKRFDREKFAEAIANASQS